MKKILLICSLILSNTIYAGEPEKDASQALLKLEIALQANNLQDILKLLSKKNADLYTVTWRSPEENLQEAKTETQRHLPKKMQIKSSEKISENEIDIMVEGLRWESDKVIYKVSMQLENEHWVFKRGKFIDFVK